jgi:hypothetical protein
LLQSSREQSFELWVLKRASIDTLRDLQFVKQWQEVNSS